jgi:hypothetical protein
MAAGLRARGPGLPPIRPRLRAASRPALVRSAISARSSWSVCGAPHTEETSCPFPAPGEPGKEVRPRALPWTRQGHSPWNQSGGGYSSAGAPLHPMKPWLP